MGKRKRAAIAWLVDDLRLDKTILREGRGGEYKGVVLVAAVLTSKSDPLPKLVLADLEHGDKEGIRYISEFVEGLKKAKALLPGESLTCVVFQPISITDLLVHHTGQPELEN